MNTSNNILNSEIKFLKGVGPKKASLLESEFDIKYFSDLLYHFPFRYIDRTQFHKIRNIEINNTLVQLKGKIISKQLLGQGRARRLNAILQDDTGVLELIWFKGIKWFNDQIKLNNEYIVFGKPSRFGNKINITHPELEKIDSEIESKGKLQPVYSTTEKLSNVGLSSKGFSKLIEVLLHNINKSLYENLNNEIVSKYNLLSHKQAITSIHFPKTYEQIQKAQFRLKYEELFFIQLQLLKKRSKKKTEISGILFEKVGTNFNEFYKNNIPFELTNAQKKVIKEIRFDFKSGKQMNRLLQGDVGSGKTMVALMCMLIAVDNKYQACIMAPTEILAQQHFNSIDKLLKGINVRAELLTGSTPIAKRKTLLKDLQKGEINILIGTHALIEPVVVFNNLGFVVIDEQHRFGVQQRAKLWSKGKRIPHILVMTATPIPRTMAMTLYGDLDYSVIDELPPGRKPVQTYHYTDSKRLALFGFMKKQIAAGRQVYIVYPLIKESETLDLKDLNDGYNSIIREFPRPEYQISVVHGQMKSKDKEYEMQRFKNHETQIMIATTVIEVGVDVPNASIMIIENAERFGLSQLHQLRGRVGRGAEQSFCILMSSYKLSDEAKIRLETMVSTNDGFKIAEADLKLRGPGDMHGIQQSGIMSLKIADLTKDEKILKHARYDASLIIDDDPELQKAENASIKKYLFQQKKNKKDWGIIS